MNSSDSPAEDAAGARSGDRRQGDRRRTDRRTPPPLWRQPWAFVAYGVTGALVLFLLLPPGDEESEEAGQAAAVGTTTGQPAVDSTMMVGADAPLRDAYGTGGYEALLASGGAAVGTRVRTTLYCEAIRSVTLRRGEDVTVSPSIAAAADEQGRVPAADCQWGDEISAPDLLLVVPPALAERFASMRQVEQSFVRRRMVPAEVEWIGRSDALSLRIVGVLMSISE